MIVFFYGGSWNSGSKDGYGFVRRALASRGFLIAIPDYRLVLAGHSAGAYNAAMLALDPHWRRRDREGAKGLIGLAGPYDFLPLEGSIAEETFGAVAHLESTQPICYVTPDDPSAFLATAGI